MSQLASQTAERVTTALSDDLNTAEAQGAIFDMLRKTNTALDAGEVRRDDVRPFSQPSTGSTRFRGPERR